MEGEYGYDENDFETFLDSNIDKEVITDEKRTGDSPRQYGDDSRQQTKSVEMDYEEDFDYEDDFEKPPSVPIQNNSNHPVDGADDSGDQQSPYHNQSKRKDGNPAPQPIFVSEEECQARMAAKLCPRRGPPRTKAFGTVVRATDQECFSKWETCPT
ncbi:hypothetical protein HK102_004629 [Quaeritorhiza haematococci]|nr:hypothetical protein HK102_004629 [Quaeritorhiza haematococci]